MEEKERRAVEEQMDEFAKQRQTKGSRPGAAGNTAGGGGFAKETGASGGSNGGGFSSGSGGSQGGFKRRKRSYVPVKGNVIMGSAVYGLSLIHIFLLRRNMRKRSKNIRAETDVLEEDKG